MLKKIVLKPGVSRENTSYSLEGGWYACDKIRFRQSTPQKIGGWNKISNNTYEGICRSLWTWETLAYVNLIGVGTNVKFYVSRGGLYYDITPVRYSQALSAAFAATTGSTTITVTAAGHGCLSGDTVTFNGVSALGGVITAAVLNTSFVVTVLSSNTYTITASVAANSSDTGTGGSAARAVYLLNIGSDYQAPYSGWGSGAWGSGAWGIGTASTASIRLWSQNNYGQDLIFGYHGGAIYYWYANRGVTSSPLTISIASPAVMTVLSSSLITEGAPVMFETSGYVPTGLTTGTVYYARNYNELTGQANLSATPSGALINTSGTQLGTHYLSYRAVNLSTISGASDVPTIQNYLYVSDLYRFVFAFGCNDYGSTTQDPLLIRWSDQENAADWTTRTTNQAGSLKLTRGSQIITCQQTRQEIVVFTDSAVYAMQYLGYPLVWNAQLIGDNISIASENVACVASGVVYWMGKDKFYMYDGRVQTLDCSLRQYVYADINMSQLDQCFSGTNEGFNEVWWFYPSADASATDRYVIYNYVEKIWYYGTMARSAWLDSGILSKPIAATYVNNIVNHEEGFDDYSGTSPVAIYSYIESSEIDMEDGDNFVFIRRVLPDFGFDGSTNANPSVTMTISPMLNSGSGYKNPMSVAGEASAAVTRSATVPIEAFTGQVFIRVRGRQFTLKIENNEIGTQWQSGAHRLDIQADGTRGT
jgi:hypothetical protein